MAATDTVDVRELRRRLEGAIEGEVRFDTASKALYATDASNYRQVPLGVVVPKTLEDIVATHRICHELGAPITPRGGGTSLSGETVNFAVIIDVSKYLTEIGEPDAATSTVICQPGVINEKLNEKTGSQIGMIFGPDPSTHSRCTIGGNLGNNSCGIHSVQSQLYGPGPRTSDSVEALEIVTHDGSRFWVGVNEEDRLDEIIAAGGRKGEIYSQLRDLRDRYADLIRERYHPVSRASPAGVGLQPRRAAARAWVQRGSGAGRNRRHLRNRIAGQVQAHAGDAGADAGGGRVRRVARRRRARDGDHRGVEADRLGGARSPADREPERVGHARIGRRGAAAPGRAPLELADGAVRRRRRGGIRGRGPAVP